MIYPVHMLANQPEYCVRNVYVGKYVGNNDQVLSRIFRNGQNDMMDQLPPEHRVEQCCSVSVGDVAEVDGKYWLCCWDDWREMTPAQFEAYKTMPQNDRLLVVLKYHTEKK